MLDFLIKFLAVIGFLIILSYLISYLHSYYQSRIASQANKKINPPPSYMQNNGVKCPDYFVNTATLGNNYVCSNRDFNLNVRKNSNIKCYSNNEQKIVEFPKIPDGKTWEFGNPDGLSTMTHEERYNFVNEKNQDGTSRCDWIKGCGASENVNGVWQGIQRVCNSPDPSKSTIG